MSSRWLRGGDLARVCPAVLLAFATPSAHAQDLSNLPDLVDRAALSVVSVRITKPAPPAAQPHTQLPGGTAAPLAKEPPAAPNPAAKDQQPGQPPLQAPPSQEAQIQRMNGTGMVLSPDGFIITAAGLIEGANSITVVIGEEKYLPARLIGLDKRTDIGLIKIEPPRPMREVRFADSNYVRRGQAVVALGNPFGLGVAASFGIISATRRDVGLGPYDYLQTDAAIGAGDSGDPLFNFDGEVVGMVVPILAPAAGTTTTAFAVPSNILRTVALKLKEVGGVARGWLGVKIQTVNEELATSLGLDKPGGALVIEIGQASPASGSGLAAGDVILLIDGRSIADSRQFARTVAEFAPGTEVELGIARKGASSKVRVKLGQAPGEMAAVPTGPAPSPASTAKQLGLLLAPAPAGKTGVLVERVEPDSVAAQKEVIAGDLIAEVGGESVASPRDVDFEIEKARKAGRSAVLIGLRSGDQGRFVSLSFKTE